jgi:hypothetical protein
LRESKQTPRVSKTTREIELALRRAGRQARKVAKMYGTRVYTMKNGKIIAEKP